MPYREAKTRDIMMCRCAPDERSGARASWPYVTSSSVIPAPVSATAIKISKLPVAKRGPTFRDNAALKVWTTVSP
jgi:hypothetical protein